MDYGQLVIVHLTRAPVRHPRDASDEERCYRSRNRGPTRAKRPRLRLGGVTTLLVRTLRWPLAQMLAR